MRLALSSYTYPWAVGVPGHAPETPLRALDLLQRTSALGVHVLQIADNLPLAELSPSGLEELAATANDLGVDLEVGTRGIEQNHLREYVELAKMLGSPLLRVVVDRADDQPTPAEALTRLSAMEGHFRDHGITLAIENHDRFRAQELADLVQSLGDWTGVCLDTINSFGALEGPAVVLKTLAPLAVNLHLKDFAIRRMDHNLGFVIEGRPAGAGQLDVLDLLDLLERYQRVDTVVLELWTPPAPSLRETVDKEEHWARNSIDYLRSVARLD